MSNFVGFYIGNHDSNICTTFYEQVKYECTERTFKTKHHKSNLFYVKNIIDNLKSGYKPDAIAFSDGNRNGLGICRDRLFIEADLGFGCPTFCIDHHYAHALSAWPVTKSYDAAVIIDGRGDWDKRVTIFRNNEIVYSSKHHGISKLLQSIGKKLGLSGCSIDYASKIAGLQAYGVPSKQYLEKIDIECDPILYPSLSKWNGEYHADNVDFLDWLASMHKAMEEYILNIFHNHISPQETVVFAGGCAQNTIINTRLRKYFPNIVIPPHANDGGISLGCVQFLWQKFVFLPKHPYLCPPLSDSQFPFWQNDESATVSDSIISTVAEYLVQGKTVGWYQGHGEIGPRSLGHRSILFDPRRNAHRVNRIKQRDSWRPYGASVIKERASDFFDVEDSPYMLYTGNVKKSDLLPGICHVDNTCRVHTVNNHEDCFFKLLQQFEKRSGIPVLLNTSLNVSGQPIVSSIKDAIQLMNTTDLDVLCVGDQIITKQSSWAVQDS